MLILRLLGLFLALSLFVGCAGQNSPDLPDVLTARPETKTTEKTSPLIKNANNSQDDLQRHLSLTPLELCGRVSGAYVVSDEQREMALVELRSRNIFTEQELQKISKKTTILF